ncbi:MAG TPA: hypothetical protein VK546_02370, partial [Gaiellales bacterium]|nr:hypothetical protein [Gaiellales bacterium]
MLLLAVPLAWLVGVYLASLGSLLIQSFWRADELSPNPIQIADAALYLSKTKPALGIKDPYELNSAQLHAAVTLLKSQRPLIKAYWGFATDEVKIFQTGGATLGAAW